MLLQLDDIMASISDSLASLPNVRRVETRSLDSARVNMIRTFFSFFGASQAELF